MIDKNIIEKALAKEHNISDEKQDPGNRLWEIVEIIVYNDTNNTNRNKDENPDKEKV